jgi:hypothetical protein
MIGLFACILDLVFYCWLGVSIYFRLYCLYVNIVDGMVWVHIISWRTIFSNKTQYWMKSSSLFFEALQHIHFDGLVDVVTHLEWRSYQEHIWIICCYPLKLGIQFYLVFFVTQKFENNCNSNSNWKISNVEFEGGC